MNNKELIIITGASSGIGEAVALKCAKMGFNLVLSGRDSVRLKDVAEKCNAYGVLAIPICGDITDTVIRSKILAAYKDSEYRLVALVNSAGLGRFASPSDITDEMMDEMFNVNVKALFGLSRDLLRMKNKDDFLTIINISSDCDQVAFPDAAGYCATKGGVLMLSKAFALATRKDNVRTTCISPGRVDTHFNNKKPGMRKGALMAEQVADVVIFAITADNNIEIQEIRIDSMSRL